MSFGLYIAKSIGSTVFGFDLAEQDVVAIVNGDSGIGFDYQNGVIIDGYNCYPVTYLAPGSGLTHVRMAEMVNDPTLSPRVVIFAVPSNFQIGGGPTTVAAGGITYKPHALETSNGNPLTNDIAIFYDVKLCNDQGVKVKKQPSGRTGQATSCILYHELSHAYHMLHNSTNSSSNQEEQAAISDENDLRTIKNMPKRRLAGNDPNWKKCKGPKPPCCIVASLSTGSPYSEEINRFRDLRDDTLRESLIGDDFFNEFFYRYYGFSPEVTRLMGHHPNLKPVILQYFVTPLLAGVELLIHYADNRGENLAKFLREQARRKGLSEIHHKRFLDELAGYLRTARNFDQQVISKILKVKGKDYDGFEELLKYINAETFKDEYINWSLVAVVELWVESAILLYSNRSEAEIDFEIYEKIVNWIGYMPISAAWRDLSRLQTELELQSLEQFIFDPRSKSTFADRLVRSQPEYSETINAWSKK
jgi:hypothetical protein